MSLSTQVNDFLDGKNDDGSAIASGASTNGHCHSMLVFIPTILHSTSCVTYVHVPSFAPTDIRGGTVQLLSGPCHVCLGPAVGKEEGGLLALVEQLG